MDPNSDIFVKPEHAEVSPTGNYDETFFSETNVVTETTSDSIIQIEISFPDLPIEFEPTVDLRRGFQYSGGVDDCTEMHLEAEKDLSNPHTCNFKSEPASPAPLSSGAEDTDMDISFSDVKQECIEYSRNADLCSGSRIQDYIFSDVSLILPRRSPEFNTAGTAKEKSRKCVFTHIRENPYNEKEQKEEDKGLTQSGKKPFSCPQCTHICKRKCDLRSHMLTHTGEKLFSCSHCSYTCYRKGDLNRHVLTHTGEKPVSCPQCSYICKRKCDLRRHMLIHTGDKLFSCSHCSYKCNRTGQLKIHLLSHTGEKQFSCSYCIYTCNEKGTLKRHMLTHTGIKPFSCSLCNYTCIEKRCLRRHVLTHSH